MNYYGKKQQSQFPRQNMPPNSGMNVPSNNPPCMMSPNHQNNMPGVEMDDISVGMYPNDLPMNHYNPNMSNNNSPISDNNWPMHGNNWPMPNNNWPMPGNNLPMQNNNWPNSNNNWPMPDNAFNADLENMSLPPTMHNMPMMNNVPMMNNMPIMNDFPMQPFDNCESTACPPITISPGDLKKVLELIKQAVSGESEDRLFYEYLISIAPTDEEKDLIKGIRDDEIKHFGFFRDIYKELSGNALPIVSEGDFKKPKSYCDGLKDALLGEQMAVQKYRQILFILVDKNQINKLIEIITDEIRHGSIYNYLYSRNKCIK